MGLSSGLIEGAPMDTASVPSEYARPSTQFFPHVCSFRETYPALFGSLFFRQFKIAFGTLNNYGKLGSAVTVLAIKY